MRIEIKRSINMPHGGGTQVTITTGGWPDGAGTAKLVLDTAEQIQLCITEEAAPGVTHHKAME